MTLYTLALELTLVLAAWLAVGAWQRERDVPGRLTYAMAALGVALWIGGELIEQRAETYLLARRVRCLGFMLVPAMWFGVAAHAVKLPMIRRTPWIPWVLAVPLAPIYALLYAGPWSVMFIPATDAPQVTPGPLIWWVIGYGWSLTLAGFGLLLWGAWKAEDGTVRRQRVKMALSVLVPLATNAVSVWHLAQTDRTPPDFTPVAVAATLIAFRRSILSGGVLDVLPVAQRDIIQHLPFGVVLADDRGAVIDMNLAAEDLLEMTRIDALGRALEAVISRAPLDVRIEISNVRGRGGESARFALLEVPKGGTPGAEVSPSPAG